MDRVGRVEKRGGQEGDGLLDGLGENRRHGWDGWDGWDGWGGWITGLVVAKKQKQKQKICGKDGRAANYYLRVYRVSWMRLTASS